MQTIEELKALLPLATSLPAIPLRVVMHWTQGPPTPDQDDLNAYHFVVNQETCEVVPCVHGIAANMRKLKVTDNYAQHTHNLNSFSIGVSMCGMLNAGPYPHPVFGPHPLTEAQVGVFINFIACICLAYNINPASYRRVLSHYEAQTLLGVTQNHKFDITMLKFRPELGPDEVGPWLRERITEATAKLSVKEAA